MNAWIPLAGYPIDGLGDEPPLPPRCIYCGTSAGEVWWIGYRYTEANWYWLRHVCDDCYRSRRLVRHERRHRRAARRRRPA